MPNPHPDRDGSQAEGESYETEQPPRCPTCDQPRDEPGSVRTGSACTPEGCACEWEPCTDPFHALAPPDQSTGGDDPRVSPEQVAPAAPRGESPDLFQSESAQAEQPLGEREPDPLYRGRCENWSSRASLGMAPATPAQWEELRDLLLEAATRVPASDLQAAEAERGEAKRRFAGLTSPGNVTAYVCPMLGCDSVALVPGPCGVEDHDERQRERVELVTANAQSFPDWDRAEAAEAREDALRAGLERISAHLRPLIRTDYVPLGATLPERSWPAGDVAPAENAKAIIDALDDARALLTQEGTDES